MSGPEPLKVLQPTTLVDSMLLSTNVPENDHPTYSSTTTYALGARVIVIATHKVYESVQAGNVNKDPATSPTWWLEVGPTNRWKAFDTSNSTRTLAPTGTTPTKITYVIKPGKAIDSVAFLSLKNATAAYVKLVDPVYGVVYETTRNLAPLTGGSAWWVWFFGQRTTVSQALFFDIPTFPNATMTLELTGTTDLAVGVIIFGQTTSVGFAVQIGARVGNRSYSRKEFNEFGDVTLKKGLNSKRMNLSILVYAGQVDSIQEFFESIDATPCLFTGTTKYGAMQIFGFYEDFETLINYQDYSDCEVQIQGLT